MDLDLGRALHDAARGGTAHLPGIDAAPVVQRIRRRRAVRHAVEGTVGVAAAGAVAVGAVQVTQLRDPAPVEPVATPTSEPTPTPTPTPAPESWAAVTASTDLACGAAVPAIDDPAGDQDLRLEPVVRSGDTVLSGASPDAPAAALAPDAPVSVEPVLVNGTAQDVTATATGDAQAWFVQGGTVVGRLAAPDGTAPVGGGTEYTGGPGARFASDPLSGVAVACAPEGGTEPLPPGDYTVYVVQTLRLSDDVTVRVTGAPVPVAVAAPEPPPVDPHPDVEDLVISPAGLGPLAVGVPPGTNPGSAMIEWDPDHCDLELFPGTEAGRWVPSGYPDVTLDGNPRPPFHVHAEPDSVRWIDVLVPQIRTAEGVGVGTTLAQLQAAYPGLEGPHEGVTSRAWWLTGPTGVLVFETQGPDSGLQPAGTPEKVVVMHVLEAGSDPRFTAYNTDQIAGGCL